MDIEEIEGYSLRYSGHFRSGVHANTGKCSAYLKGTEEHTLNAIFQRQAKRQADIDRYYKE